MEIQKGLLKAARTHNLGELRRANAGQDVILMGWVHRRRDHGQVIFIDMRDRFGITQIVLDTGTDAELAQVGSKIRQEFVIMIQGTVVARPDNMANTDLPTGEVEIHVKSLQILNESEPLPFPVVESDKGEASDNLRLKYRYLDLRRPRHMDNILKRINFVKAMRRALEDENFLEIETPYLYKSTPEGAREYLVPSRVHPGHFYALPQSPQLFKQVLMISGFDRYYQVVRCFRDEDQRADRQPEFTQVDIEVSYTNQSLFLPLMEKVLQNALTSFGAKTISWPLPRMTFAEAMEKYGNDKPDTRFGLELHDLSEEISASSFKVFKEALDLGGIVNALVVPKGSERFSRKDFDELGEMVKKAGGRGLAWAKIVEEGGAATWQSPIAKFFTPELVANINKKIGAQVGDVVFFGAGSYATTKASLSELRNHLGKRLKLYKPGSLNFLWIYDFPLFERDDESGRLIARHHPFTMPHPDDLAILEESPEKARASAYDLVLNGYEVAGGSIRIHNQALQQKIFSLVGLTEEEARSKFGFLLDALKFGAPPHGGIAFGLDRLAMVLSGCDAIRDVIAFPKTQKATCLMTDSPAVVPPQALMDLHIKLRATDIKDIIHE